MPRRDPRPTEPSGHPLRPGEPSGHPLHDDAPPAGWQVPGSEREREARGPSEAELLAQLLQSVRELVSAEPVRDLVPPELQRRLSRGLRELLLAVRAVLDLYIERLEPGQVEPAEVQDIPIL